MNTRLVRTLLVPALVAAAAVAWSGDAPHAVYTPDAIKWVDPPPFVPKGSKVAVLYGDPSKPGLLVLQADMPANYLIPPHSHPTDEVVTVLRGTLLYGMGDKVEPGRAKALPAGSVFVAPARMNHFVQTKERTLIQVTGNGPLAFTYVNPADDPSKQ